MTVEGMGQLERNFAQLANPDLNRVLNAPGFVLEGYAKRFTVEMGILDTGAFLNGIAVRDVASGPDSAEKTVGTNVEYAVYQEVGTAHTAARPSHRRAFDEGKQPAIQAAADEMSRQIGEAIR